MEVGDVSATGALRFSLSTLDAISEGQLPRSNGGASIVGGSFAQPAPRRPISRSREEAFTQPPL